MKTVIDTIKMEIRFQFNPEEDYQKAYDKACPTGEHEVVEEEIDTDETTITVTQTILFTARHIDGDYIDWIDAIPFGEYDIISETVINSEIG